MFIPEYTTVLIGFVRMSIVLYKSSNCKQHCRNMAEAEHLGGGLDIDGWSFLKNDVQTKINEMTDRSLILRSTFPLVLNSHLKNEKDQKTAYDLIVAIMESKSTIDHPWIGSKYFT